MTAAELARHYSADELLAALCAKMDPALAVAAVRAVAPFLSADEKAARAKRLAAERSKRSYHRSKASEPHGSSPSESHGTASENASESHAEPSESHASSDGAPLSPPCPPPGPPQTPPSPSPLIPLSPVPAPAAAGRRTKAKPDRGEDSTPTDPRFSAVVAGYSAEWALAFPSQVGGYRFEGGRDGKALKDFLAGVKAEVTAEQIVGVIRRALERSKEQFATACKRASTLHGFCGAWNDIRREITAHGANGSANGRAPAESDLHTRKGRFGI